jgi:tetratricopeptide (TPR) repeat protein
MYDGAMRTVLLAAALLVCAPVRADENDEVMARAHFFTGRAHYEAGRYGEALKEFEAAYQRSPRPGFLFNIGVCEEKLGHTARAVEAYRLYLANHPAAEDVVEVRARIARLEAPPSPPSPAPVAPVALVAPAEPSASPEHRPRWVWGVLGGLGAAVVVAGVVVGVVLGTRGDSIRTLRDVTAQ